MTRFFYAQPLTCFEALGGGGERGNVFFCCQNWITKSIGSIADELIEKVWNSKAACYIPRWLQTMTRVSMPNLERIHLHSDRLPWTKRIWEPISKEIRALIRVAKISINAAKPETYGVNRRGGDFDTLLEGLAPIADLRAQGLLKCLEFRMMVQANNSQVMPKFVALGRHHCDRVTFHQMLDWGTFIHGEFSACAIQLPDYPKHPDFLAMLADQRLEEPIAYLSNLTDLKCLAVASLASAIRDASR